MLSTQADSYQTNLKDERSWSSKLTSGIFYKPRSDRNANIPSNSKGRQENNTSKPHKYIVFSPDPQGLGVHGSSVQTYP